MTKITVSANLFCRAALCQSTEETRYRLKGVHVEPCAAGGALLVATDNHKLIALRDKDAAIDGKPAGDDKGWIVSADKDALKAMKSPKPYGGVRLVQIDGDQLRVIHREGTRPDVTVYIQAASCLVDGTYPDWRRVVPRDVVKTPSPGSFDNRVLATLAEALSDGGKNRPLTLFGVDDASPALAYGGATLDGFGIAMPLRSDYRTEPELPAWIT